MTTYTSSTGKSGITDIVSGGYSSEMTVPNKASDRNKEFRVILNDCLEMKRNIECLERKLDRYARQDLVWFQRHDVKGLDQEQTGVIDINKIKEKTIHKSVIHIGNSLDWDWDNVSCYDYCDLLTEYADKVGKGDL